MSQKFVQKIFSPFERERTSTVSRTQGTGLGMAITKNIVDMMGGTEVAMAALLQKLVEKKEDVTLLLVEKRGEMCIRDRDNGIGMSQEFVQKIFSPFERERTSTVSRTQGTGLGMALSLIHI